MNVYGEITGTLTSGATIKGTLSSGVKLAGKLTVPSAILPDEYEGAYTVTPSSATQTLATTDRWLIHDIVINPIPSNYGLITWNGSVLTVS